MEPVTRWYTVLNYGVHSLMYPYFALKAIHVSIPSKIANLITTLQLAQMIMGFAVNMLSLYFRRERIFYCFIVRKNNFKLCFKNIFVVSFL